MSRVSVIGAGWIGTDVIAGVDAMPGFVVERVLTRSGVPDTADAADFLSTPCDIVIETAGPDALRALGAAVLEKADLWTVSASALADDALLAELRAAAERNGRAMRLFSHWIAGADHVQPAMPASIAIVARRPGIGAQPGVLYHGDLRTAAARYPAHVNSAVAAALCGPGLDHATIEIVDTGPDGEHSISATVDTGFSRFTTRIDLPAAGEDGVHPTAAAILSALRRGVAVLRYG